MQRLAAVTFALFLLLVPAACRASLPVIVCFGDSLTAGFRSPTGMAYPDFLQMDLRRNGYHYNVVTMGVDGNSTTEALNRVPLALQQNPAIVVLEEGGVDGLRGVPVDVVRRNLSTMIEQFQKAHVKVLLVAMQTLPNLGPDYVKQFDALYPELAKQFHIPITRFMLDGIYGNPNLMSDDGIHPIAPGYKKIADDIIFPALVPLLQK